MARILPIASGSDGNCILIGIAGRKFLIDTGISCERISSALYGASISPHSIDAIFITHEHEDHIKGLLAFQKKFHKPLYTTNGTAKALESFGQLSRYCDINIIKQNKTIKIKIKQIKIK
jgi:phosphoribosyl 1,2-cyclic phosphodiesterase